jgi:hypothetical protein
MASRGRIAILPNIARKPNGTRDSLKRRVEHHNKHLSNTVKLIITKDITTADFNQNVR